MEILGLNINLFGGGRKPQKLGLPETSEPQAFTGSGKSIDNLVPLHFGGEKTPYEMGRPFDFQIDYYTMRARTWESYLKSDIVQNAIRKYCLWIVGSGLKLQSDIKEDVLKKFGIDLDEVQIDTIQKDIESQFRLFASLSKSTYNENESLHTLAAEALKNAIIAGDVLCIARYDGDRVSMEVIDGHYVQNPLTSNYWDEAGKKGHTIVDGVETDRKGKHVAYYVRQKDFSYRRIRAYGAKSKRRQSWLMYGLKHKMSDTRGMSLFTAVLETFEKMDRYRGATLSGAENNAKIAWSIRHDKESTGENPFANTIKQSFGKDKGVAPETESLQDDAASKVAQMTNGQYVNLPNGAQLERHAGSTDDKFADFFNVNIDIVYATLGIPPEVAMDKFEQNYSSSRAALKSWEYKMIVDREVILKTQYYKPFFNFWLDIAILDNMVNAGGYLQALGENNYMVLESYRNCRFIGAGVPHIDPAKEVKAEREKLGPMYASVPLGSAEQSMENLNTGDYSQNIKKVKDEKRQFDEIKSDVEPPPANGGGGGNGAN